MRGSPVLGRAQGGRCAPPPAAASALTPSAHRADWLSCGRRQAPTAPVRARCQTTSGADPLLNGGGACSIASEALRQRDGEEFVELEIDDRLQGLGGGAVAQGLGEAAEPIAVAAATPPGGSWLGAGDSAPGARRRSARSGPAVCGLGTCPRSGSV